jgi:hypothetical protein
VHLCAIIGGVYAIAQVLHNTSTKFMEKYEYQLIQ